MAVTDQTGSEQKPTPDTYIDSSDLELNRIIQKQVLKIIVMVIPKEGLAGTSTAKSSFGMIPTACRIVLCYLHRLYFTVSVIAKEYLAELVPDKPSVGMTITKILRPVFA